MLDRVVTGASVAVLAEMRESDYVLRLTSPQGTSVILSENRGFFDTSGFGSSLVTTNGTNGLFLVPLTRCSPMNSWVRQ